MSPALLLAEPEVAARATLEHHLAEDGFAVLGAEDETRALWLAERARPDVVLLASRLEQASGAEVCRRLRAGAPGRDWDRDIPVIVLGDPDGDATDRVRAFAHGADDYVPGPVLYEELLARIRAVLRRAAPTRHDVVEAGPVRVDVAARHVTVHGRTVHLSGTEFALLLTLARDPFRVFAKRELLRDVWGYPAGIETRTVDSHASRVRRKLAAAGGQEPLLLNEWGIGYRLRLPGWEEAEAAEDGR
jgi:DNA-binding response OmpR family regulator